MSTLLEYRDTARAVRTFGREQISASTKIPMIDIESVLHEFSAALFTEATNIQRETPLGILVNAKASEIQAIADFYGLGDVYVFGSVAEGRDNSESDVDFIVTGDFSNFTRNVISASTDLSELLNVEVDLTHPDSFADFALFMAYTEVSSVSR